MSSSSESSNDDQRYLAVPTVISRRVRDGVIVRRWDVDAPAVLLNDSAWAVLQAVALAVGAIDIAAIVTSVAELARVDPESVDDLGPVLDLLVAGNLVASAR